MRPLIAAIAIAPITLGTMPVAAQSNPSADEIIRSLKPSGNPMHGGTRGIRLAAPSSDATAPAATAPAGRQQASQAADPAVNLTVNFATGSAELTVDATRTLDELGRALSSRDLASYRFRIEGHTDTVGSREYNQALSERRATAVVDYVVRKYDVDPARLQAVGLGEDSLLVQTPSQTPEPRNRRVQVINLGA